MKFKTLAFLSVFSILFFAGCDSKDKKDENIQSNAQQKIELKSEFILNSVQNSVFNIKIEDNKLKFAEKEGKIILVNFFATWCPPCKAEVPSLIKLQDDFKNDFEVISVLLEEFKSDEEINDFIKEFGINYEITKGGDNFDLAKALGGIKSIPTMFLVDKDGKIFQKYVGLVPAEMLEIDIKKLLEK